MYVDDLIIAGNISRGVTDLKTYLCRCFHMKDLGALKYFLRVGVSHGANGIYLSQRKYALDIVAEIGLLGGKPIGVPIDQNYSLDSSLMLNPGSY